MFGGGGVSSDSFVNFIETVSRGIKAAAKILNDGDEIYVNGPSTTWAEGVGASLVVFADALNSTTSSGKGIWAKMFSGDNETENFVNFIDTVSTGINAAAVSFKKDGVTYKGGPEKDWAEGIGYSITAFANAFNSTMGSGKSLWQKMFGGGSTTKDFVDFIDTVSKGINAAATTFKSDKDIYSGGPEKEWAEGVAMAMTTFVIEFDSIKDIKIKPTEFKLRFTSISETIKQVADDFNGIDFTGGPNDDWIKNIRSTIFTVLDILNLLDKKTITNLNSLEKISSDLRFKIVPNFVGASNELTNTKWDILPPKPWLDNMILITDVAKTINGVGMSMFSTTIKDLAKDMKNASLLLGEGIWTKYPDDKWIKSMNDVVDIIVLIGKKIDDEKIKSLNNFSLAVRELSYSFASLSNSGIDKMSNLNTSLTVLTKNRY